MATYLTFLLKFSFKGCLDPYELVRNDVTKRFRAGSYGLLTAFQIKTFRINILCEYRCASYADSFGNQKSLLNPSGLVAKVHETGKTCSSEFYLSRKFEVHNCDGWSNVSREDCVQKCGKNELPSGCPATDGVCKYAHYKYDEYFWAEPC